MLVDRIDVSGWKFTNMRATNVTGTMLDIPTMEDDVPFMDATPIPDEYTIVASAVSGDTATFTISASSGDANPWHGKVITGHDFVVDNWVIDWILGVAIYLNTGITNGWTSTIKVGVYGGTLSAGGVTAGVATGEVRHQVENDGTEDVTECSARLLTQVVHVPMTDRPEGALLVVRPFADGATEKTDPVTGQTKAYKILVSGVTGAGASKVCTLTVDGEAFGTADIFNITTSTYEDGVGLKAITYATPYPYRIVNGPLTGLEFVIFEGVANGDYSNILIFENRHIQIAPDSSGVAGEWGTEDVPITETGETEGTITPSGLAYYWSRFLVEEGSGGLSNPHPCNIALFGNEDEPGSADWES